MKKIINVNVFYYLWLGFKCNIKILLKLTYSPYALKANGGVNQDKKF
jgi:hypothetical protein